MTVYYKLPEPWASRLTSDGGIWMTEAEYEEHKRAGTLPSLDNMVRVEKPSTIRGRATLPGVSVL